jgi:hypothetical protein
MSSSLPISLFSEQLELSQKPYSFVFSVLAHGVAIGLLLLGILSAPKVKTPTIAERYDVRHLDLSSLYPEVQRAAKSAVEAPRTHPKALAPPLGKNPSDQPPALQQVVQAPLAPQTLVQPDIPKPLALTEEIPVPTVLIWDAKKFPSKTIVPPPPETPPIADVKPSIQLPNEEQNLADIAIPASDQPVLNQPILASTTTPLVVSGPVPTPPASVTTAQGSAQPTSTTVMSLSDQSMANGVVTLPPVNESASSNSPGAPGQSGQGSPTGKAGGIGAGQGSDQAGDTSNRAGAAQGDNTGSGLGNRPTATHISRQMSGQFGAVVVGSSLEEKYPETAALWSGRLSYTVYLPVGLAKSWIIQYSLSRADNAAAAGNIAHIEPPWPYSILRPNIAPGAINADALMVHGFVNQAGRFEALAIVFPPEFSQAQFVLATLAQWQFRPATQNGQNVKVEMLLIIPEEPE